MLYVQSFVFSPVQENTYILYNENKEALIIDPGCYYDEEKETLAAFIETNGLIVKLLLNTHCHLDHIFGNKFIAEKYNLPLHLHPLEEKIFEAGPSFGLMWNLPFENYTGKFVYLKEGETIKLGEDVLELIHCPGHSPGSICFYCRKQNFVIGGDVLFYRSIGRADLPGADFNTLQASIQDKMYTLPDETIVYSGHGEPTTIGDEKRENPYVRA